MNTIKNNCQNTIIIKNSKFICFLYKINSLDEINDILKSIKKEYYDATHHCYAYIINNIKKSSDDGEPSGTAGIPMLKTLDTLDLNNILAIVVRYYGGINLGANGLIRAYSKSITNALENTTIVKLINGLNINITFDYNKSKEIDYLLKNIKINNKQFNDKIIYNLDIESNFLKTIINNNLDYQIIKDIYIEK